MGPTSKEWSSSQASIPQRWMSVWGQRRQTRHTGRRLCQGSQMYTTNFFFLQPESQQGVSRAHKQNVQDASQLADGFGSSPSLTPPSQLSRSSLQTLHSRSPLVPHPASPPSVSGGLRRLRRTLEAEHSSQAGTLQ